MSRPLDADNLAAVAADVTAPRWFVQMGFDSTVRLTNAETVNWTAGGGTYTQADIDVKGVERPVVRIFNEAAALGVTVLAQIVAGNPISVWQAYVDSSASSSLTGYTEPVLLFAGLMSVVELDDARGLVQINTRRAEPLSTPRSYVAAPVFNHLPKPGTVIEMPSQKITLE